MRRLLAVVGGLALLLVAVMALWYTRASEQERFRACVSIGICEEPADILGSALLSVRKERQLVVFSARLITALTAVDTRSLLGMKLGEARKTMIVPATARYALDLTKLSDEDLTFDPATRTVRVKRPPLVILGPEIDIARAQEYVDGRLLLAITNSEAELDRINREQARARFIDEARAPDLIKLARAAADEALAASLLLPLRAAGMADAKIVVEAG